MTLRPIHAVPLILIALACSPPASSSIPEPKWVRVVGVIDSGGQLGPLVVPSTANAGVPFDITIATYGGSGCIHPDQSEISYHGSSVAITPYDSMAVDPPCLPDWHRYARTVQLTFGASGPVTVSLRGRGPGSQKLIVEHVVSVLP